MLLLGSTSIVQKEMHYENYKSRTQEFFGDFADAFEQIPEEKRIKVRRGAEPTFAMPAMQAPVASAAAAPAAGSSPAEAPAEDDNTTAITSPMVGTFYTKPKPDAPNFISVGDHVNADTVVCLVEAMKMFNEIPAGISGTVTAVLVKNEEPVDVGKPLFKVIPD